MRGVLTGMVFALLLGAGAARAQDTTPPELLVGTFLSVQSQTFVQLYFNENLSITHTLRTDAFTTSLGTASNAEYDTGEEENNVVKLTFPTTTTATQAASITVNASTVQDTAGNLLKEVRDFELTNTHGDNAPKEGTDFKNPALSDTAGAVVNGDTLTLTYGQRLLPRWPPTTAFTVNVTPTRTQAVTVSSLAINPDTPEDGKSTVVLTLSAAMKATDGVTLTYANPGSSKRPIQNEWGIQAADLTNESVTNNTPPVASIRVKENTKATITEGEEAQFTVTLTAASTGSVTVNLEITQTGTYVDSGDRGDKTVDVAASSTTADYDVETDNDSLDEPNGTVTATLKAGTGYTVGATNHTASVTVNDNDVPMASIARDRSAVTEGGRAIFTVTLDPVPAIELTVNLEITQVGDVVAIGDLNAKTVTVATGGSTAKHTVNTVDDSTHELNGGVVTATLRAGDNYTVDTMNDTASITVNDNDKDPAQTPQDMTPPRLVAGSIASNGGIHLYFSERLAWRNLAASQFSVIGSVTDLGAVNNPAISHNVIQMGINTPPAANDTVTLTISDTTGIQDIAGNKLETIPSFTLVNTVASNPGAPGLSAASVRGDKLVLTYDKPMLPNRPPDDAFTVTVTPSTTTTVTDLIVMNDHSATTATVVLTLSAAVQSTDTVTLSYNTADDYAPRLQSMWGTRVAALTDQTVTNDTGKLEASISRDHSAVTEGAEAEFTVTLTPAPATDVDVNLTITQMGDFVADTDELGAKTVTVPT